MATLVADDPESSREETGPEAIQGPKCETSEPVRQRMGQVNDSGVNERVEVGRGLVNAANHEAVPKAVHNGMSRRQEIG